MRLVLLESPFAAQEENTPQHPGFPGGSFDFILYARRATADALRRGESPMVSHLLFTQTGILKDTNKKERALGINAGTAWLDVADGVVVYADHGISPGMKQRIDMAEALGMAVEYREIGKKK